MAIASASIPAIAMNPDFDVILITGTSQWLAEVLTRASYVVPVRQTTP
jgi:hypothetical protein